MTSRTTHPLEGHRLGDFLVGREIGRGGMGVVYEAQQVSLNRRVALKVLSSTVGLTLKAVQRFHREAEAAAKLHHTNIVPVYATGEQDGAHFYAMELIEGPSLDQVIRQLLHPDPVTTPPGHTGPEPTPIATTGPYPEPNPLATTGPHVEGTTASPSGSGSGLGRSSLSSGSGYFDAAAGLLAGVADALDYAHREGVIHRDVKPSNLLLSPAGRLSVNDFGLARMLEQPGMTITGEMVGTPRYMSPEQITAGRVPVDHRTDVYSLGATLYELLTLQPPFPGEQRDQLLAQIIQKEPRPPRKVNPKVPVDLETICLKAMDKDPDRRYQTAGQLADDLRRYVNRFAILARRAGPLGRIKKWVKRNPALSAALTGVLACAAVAGGLAYRGHLAESRWAEEQARHEDDLLAEKRRGALDKAILASRLENFDEARQAIREAEKLGCSAGQIRMLQGQLELCQGRVKEAIEQLSQATELLPESVAAWSMLAVAYARSGQQTGSNRALSAALRLPAVLPEDFLFRGYAECNLDPEQGLVSLNEAMRRRPSALARLLHCEALRLQVLNAPDVERARLAMDDMRFLKRELPENAMLLSTSLMVHLTCMQVFEEFGTPALSQAARAEGMRDARALERYPDSVQAVVSWWAFMDLTGQAKAGVDKLKRACERTKAVGLIYYYGLYLYRTGDFQQAMTLLDPYRGETSLDYVRILVAAELPDGFARANSIYQELAARDLSDWDLFNSQLMLRFLGRKAEAVAVSRKFLTQPHRFPPVRQEPFRQALAYCAGVRPAEEIIAAMQGNRGDLSNAHLCVALTALADSNRAEARKHLQLCQRTRFFEFLPFDFSRALLARMDKAPAWPPWIKPRP